MCRSSLADFDARAPCKRIHMQRLAYVHKNINATQVALQPSGVTSTRQCAFSREKTLRTSAQQLLHGVSRVVRLLDRHALLAAVLRLEAAGAEQRSLSGRRESVRWISVGQRNEG